VIEPVPLFCAGCGQDLGLASPLIEAMVYCQSCCGEHVTDSEFIVMTAVTGYAQGRCYAKVALCEVEKGVIPKMISKRAKGMVSIRELHQRLRKNGRKWRTRRSYETTLAQVTQRCAELNANPLKAAGQSS
jgi:hypothetical protein